jgi:hypothetical protein
MIKYGQLCTKYGIFFTNCGPKSPIYSKLRPADTFSIQMWPLDGFEFETPDLEHFRQKELHLSMKFNIHSLCGFSDAAMGVCNETTTEMKLILYDEFKFFSRSCLLSQNDLRIGNTTIVIYRFA